MESARSGSRTAAGELLARYDAYIDTCVRRALGSERFARDGEDVLQEVRFALARGLESLRAGDRKAFKSWIATVASNTIRDWHRRRRARRRDPGAALVRLDGTRAPEVEASGTTPSRRLLRAEDLALLEEAIERVPSRYRSVLHLIAREAPSLRSIAEFLGKEPEAARKFAARALGHLRTAIGADRGGAPQGP